MSAKSTIADEITIFFRSFRISIPVSICFLVILYFGIYQAYKTFDPDLSVVKEITYDDGTKGTVYGNSFYHKVYFKYRNEIGNSYYGIENLRYQISEAIKLYQHRKLKESIIYSCIILFGLPLILVLIDFGKKSKEWVEDNKTI